MQPRALPALLWALLVVAAACGDAPGTRTDAYSAPHDPRATPYVELGDASVTGPGRYHRRTGDLWHSTWAADGELYMTWGDGAGRGDCCSVFPGDVVVDPNCSPVPDDVPISELNNPGTGRSICMTQSFCLCRETYFGLATLGQSPAAAPQGCDAACIVRQDIPTGVPLPNSSRNDKPSSIISVGGTLYIAGHWPPGTATHGWIATSTDGGRTWAETPNSPWTAPSPFTVLMFIQMGQDHRLNADGWVYALAMGREAGWESPAGGPGEIYLARVPADRIADYGAWEYLSAVDAANIPSWSRDQAAAVPVAGLASGFQGGAIFHPETASYLFLVNNDPGALYQAERPWGPWHEVAELFHPGVSLPGWNGHWGPLMSLIPMETTVDSVQFTNSADEHYALTIGTIELVPAGVASPDTVGLVDPTQGQWHLRDPAGQVTSFFYGNPGDVPIVGDWDCDGDATPGQYRQSDGFVYLRNSNTAGVADTTFFLGNPGDVPLAGDFDADRCDTVSVYRPATQRFFISDTLGSGGAGFVADYDFLFGDQGDQPVVGDWDGDGVDEVGLHRESTGFFYWRNTLDTGIASGAIFFGDPGDRFVAGDWGDVDGVDTPAVFRPADAAFYIRHTLSQGIADDRFGFGAPGWRPVAGAFGLG